MQLVGPRIADIAGGVLYGVGVFLASFAEENYVSLWLTYGLLAGLGLGYIVPLQTLPKWFLPRAAGVTVAKYRARTVLSVYEVFDIILTGEKQKCSPKNQERSEPWQAKQPTRT